MALRWGWYNVHEGRAQEETFESPDAALAAMHKRLGDEESMERLADVGFRLALVNVEVTPVMILEDAK